MTPLFYLLTRQWKGAVLNMLRSGLRTLLGLLGFAWIFAHGSVGLIAVSQHRELPFNMAVPLPYLQGALFFMLVFPAYAVVMEGLKGGLVVFTAADVDFLFSMPLPQRGVLAFRLMLQSLQLLGWIALGTLGIAPYLSQFMRVEVWSLVWRGIVGVFLCFLFLITLAHAAYIFYAYRVRVSERLNLAVKWGGVIAAAVLVLLVTQDAMLGQSPWEQAVRTVNHPVIRIMLFPVSLAVDLIMSAHPLYEANTASRLFFLLALALAGTGLMLGQRENVYEPSIGISLRKSRLRQAFRSGGVGAARLEMIREGQWRGATGGLKAPYLGSGWRALVWKSLQIWLHAPWTSLFVIGIVALGIPLLLHHYLPAEGRMVMIAAPAMVWVYITWMSGVGVFQQVRNELAQGDFLKTLPLPPRQIVLALIAVPVIGYTLTLWVSLAAFRLLFRDVPQPFLLPLALVGPLMMAAMSLYHCMIACLFPRKKDPLSQLLAGLMMMPGWAIFLFLPITLGGVLFSALVYPKIGRAGPIYRELQDPVVRQLVNGALLLSTGALVLGYAVVVGLLLWLGGKAFRSFSPAEE